MIPIYSEQPTNWKDLQIKTAKIFEDIGYVTFIEKNIQTVRGVVNADVICTKKSGPFEDKIIIECKYWSKNIPKSVIHSFRTVISDSGASFGYIITKKGFQSGAIEATNTSNVRLLSFEEFQASARSVWLRKVIDDIHENAYSLRRYCNPTETCFDNYLEKLSRNTQQEILELQMRYFAFSLLTVKNLYKDPITNEISEDYLERSIIEKWAVYHNCKLSSLMEYYTWLNEASNKLILEFDALYGAKLRK